MSRWGKPQQDRVGPYLASLGDGGYNLSMGQRRHCYVVCGRRCPRGMVTGVVGRADLSLSSSSG